MTLLTTDDIDRELASREKEVASMSATLVELDNHGLGEDPDPLASNRIVKKRETAT
jgi:hypothetical protein